MIGISAATEDLATVAEFFELFKTPWEEADRSRRYSVAIVLGGATDPIDADVTVIYDTAVNAFDRTQAVAADTCGKPAAVRRGATVLPLYAAHARFDCVADDSLLLSEGKPVDYRRATETGCVVRVGYDLLREVRHLLTAGQPEAHAMTPTLELHIAFLRDLLRREHVSFVEIPPKPHGFDFVCCLTHDIDFCGIRRHRMDRTLLGFIGRASVGSIADVARGRRPAGDAVRNLTAVASLPLVFAGVASDPWRPFDDYAQAEGGRPSTFFVVPFRQKPGQSPDGIVESARAVPYQISDIQQELRGAAQGGAEIAVHGLDAWNDAEAGRAELRELQDATGQVSAGVRMHWLYYADHSPRQLEAAGFTYDSTWGYNGAVGYRAGTSQVFTLPGTTLAELPLSIMDSALLYPARMNLTNGEALERCDAIIANARRFGGTVVVNWHDRSLAPERLWNRCYETLLDSLSDGSRTWFATASDAVDWFKWRRSIRFSTTDRGAVAINACPPRGTLPPATVCVHEANGSGARTMRFAGGAPMAVQP